MKYLLHEMEQKLLLKPFVCEINYSTEKRKMQEQMNFFCEKNVKMS